MKAGFSSFLGCTVILLSSLNSAWADRGLHIGLTDHGSAATVRPQAGNRPAAAPLFKVTRADTNMVRLGGAPAASRGAVAISGLKRGPSGKINGQDFSHVRGNR